VICAGDFNEIPYSYSYRRLKKGLRNSFEEAGAGFGFTYNGNTLVTLRIDNQFYSDRVDCVELETLNTVSYSDHFPLLGTYVLSGGSEL
jgi:endonuclease/exonuclease/phosphatase (EEP) superfamily protein YafD